MRGHANRLGVRGWIGGGRWGLERYIYSLHRATGLGLLLYFLIHIVVTSSRAFGPEAWSRAMDAVGGPIFKLGEFLVFVAFAFHALNGVRLILVELGVLTGRAEEPVYPYRSSLHVQRPFLIVAMVLAVLLILLGGYEFFMLGPS